MSSTYKQLGERIGTLVDEKNVAYGSSFAKSGDYLRLLYPNGLKPDQYEYALLLVRDFDKSMRIATDQDAFGESPFQDKAGYALLGAQLHQTRKNGCGSASSKDAVEQSTQQSGSVAQSAPRPTTTNAEPLSEPISTQQLDEQLNDYLNATGDPAAASEERADAAALAARVRKRNLHYMQCGICTNRMSEEWASTVWGGEFFFFCSRECRAGFHRALQGGLA